MSLSTEQSDWTRTPAAIFASAVLGFASIGGLGWSIGRSIEQDSRAIQRGDNEQVAQITQSAQSREFQAHSFRSPRAGSMSAVKLININTADQAQLDLLPGIGPALASRIITDRDEHGPFDSIDDLKRVSGIGPKTVEKLRALVSLGGSKDSDDTGSVRASAADGG